MYKIDYNQKDSIIRLVISGIFTFELIEKISKELYENTTEKNILLLVDVREAIYKFSPKDFSNLIALTNKYVKKDTIIHEAILISTPKEVAISTLFEKENQKEFHKSKIFSTEEAAIGWLLKFKKQ